LCESAALSPNYFGEDLLQLWCKRRVIGVKKKLQIFFGVDLVWLELCEGQPLCAIIP